MTDSESNRQGVTALRSAPRYRAFLLDMNGRILRERRIDALCDEDAISVAATMMDGRAIDLWDGLRFIEHFPPID
ncbi:hypothetical protein ASF22_01895 [Methylobacterium sp. Leaf87]|uniref:hypothetical protein n=1 Tax=Methylobacterium sp. Leaf87 TaxID=1736243 RepID=UPI0006FF62AC|nr:hypothetical protein [Methylobacterium sp. Leaf87]KQO69386.1 hypothetical protein ASF22_01895 [Methylobacterium sp. Leaf87]